VNLRREDLFSGAHLAEQEHRDVRRCDARQQLVERVHRRVFDDDVSRCACLVAALGERAIEPLDERVRRAPVARKRRRPDARRVPGLCERGADRVQPIARVGRVEQLVLLRSVPREHLWRCERSGQSRVEARVRGAVYAQARDREARRSLALASDALVGEPRFEVLVRAQRSWRQRDR
jgi:hypothetical protein